MTTNTNLIFGVADSWGDKLEVRVPPTGDGLAIHTEHRSGTTSGGVFLTWGELQQLVRAIQGRIDMKVLDDAGFRATEDRCPRCDSPQPHLHPAVQHEGEVHICPHPWHGPRHGDR
jgi:hypothetical protein